MAVFAPLQPSYDKENRPASSGNGCVKPVQTRRRSRSSFSGPYVKTAVIGKTFEPAKPSPRTRQVQLPKTLPRPVIATPDFDALAEIDSELEGVPSAYIIEKLEALRARYVLLLYPVEFCIRLTRPSDFRFVAGAASVSPVSTIQSPNFTDIELRVNNNAGVGILPTHMFAVTNSTRSKATLYPCHHLLFASQCANLPRMRQSSPASDSDDEERDSSRITLPIVPIYLPSPETFPIVREFLYTRAFDRLLSTLLPLPSSDLPPVPTTPNVSVLPALSTALANTFAPAGLLERARTIHGVWSNACTLGIADESLWKCLDTAWSVIIDALALSTGQLPASKL